MIFFISIYLSLFIFSSFLVLTSIKIETKIYISNNLEFYLRTMSAPSNDYYFFHTDKTGEITGSGSININTDLQKSIMIKNLQTGKDGVDTKTAEYYSAWSWNKDKTTADIIIIKEQIALEPYFKIRRTVLSLFSLALVLGISLLLFFSLHYCKKEGIYREINYDLKREIDTKTKDLGKARDKLLHLNKEFNTLSTIDKQTALPNRKSFESFADLEWRHCNRLKMDVSIIIADIDHFKEYNELFGTEKGDECLYTIADGFRGSRFLSRPGDLAARYRNDEFIIILGNTSLDNAIRISGNIMKDLENRQIPHPENRSSVKRVVTLSMGVVTKEAEDKTSISELIENAYIALYKSKKDGRNIVTAFTG